MARKGSSAAAIIGLFVLSIAVITSLVAVPSAYADSTDVISITVSNGSTVCPDSLGGTWAYGIWDIHTGTYDTGTCSFSSGLTISSTMVLNIGAGVAVNSYGGRGISNSGTINNQGTITGSGGTGGSGDVCSQGGLGGNGIANSGTINNQWTITASGGQGGSGGFDGVDGNGGGSIFNPSIINNYCGVGLSYSSYDGNFPNAISCYTVTFDQSGIPTSWVIWGVTVAWGPFVLPMDHTGTGASISVQAIGSLNYAFDSPVKFTGTIYSCNTECSGTPSLSGVVTFSASYTISGSYEVLTPTTTISCSPWSFPVGSSTNCFATVTGFSPTGTVMFSTSVGATSQFSSTSCTLSSGTCQVTYTPASASDVMITASYEGDSGNAGSSGTFLLTVTSTGPSISSITTSDGSMVCPSLGGTWDAGTDTCSFSSGLGISLTMILNIGAGVTITASGGQGGCGGTGGPGIANSGTLDNDGTITASGGTGGTGCTITQGVHSYQGPGGPGGPGIANSGTLNNDGTVTGSGGSGGYNGVGYGPGGDGINNPGTLSNYCVPGPLFWSLNLIFSSYNGNAPYAISCYTVTFEQSGIPSGFYWGVTVSWGPFVLPMDYTGTGGSIAISAMGSLTYSYDSPVRVGGGDLGIWSDCTSGCSGTADLSGATTFSAAYSPTTCGTSTSSSCTTSTTIQGGKASADHMSITGVDVQIQGSSATDGTPVTITSSDLSGQPSGTGIVQLGGESFYDVQVSQNVGPGASATICINSDKASLMEYWNGAAWTDASNISVGGSAVCGTVPASALSGTPIVIGSPVYGPPPAMVDGNVTIYSSTYRGGEILFTANATISDMHSYPFTESAVPQLGMLPNGTYGYLGYYQGTFEAVSGGQRGDNVSVTVSYGGVTQTGSALDPGAGNTTSVNFVFNSTDSSQNATINQSVLGFRVILAIFVSAVVFVSRFPTVRLSKFGRPWNRATHLPGF